jgi:hypothetical protein
MDIGCRENLRDFERTVTFVFFEELAGKANSGPLKVAVMKISPKRRNLMEATADGVGMALKQNKNKKTSCGTRGQVSRSQMELTGCKEMETRGNKQLPANEAA